MTTVEHLESALRSAFPDDVVAHLATVRPMEEPMSKALETWTLLQPKGDAHV